MANKLYSPWHGTNVRNAVWFCATWTPNSAAAPTNLSGNRFTVTRNGVGSYVVTLNDKFSALMAAYSVLTADAPMISNSKLVSVWVGAYNAAAGTLALNIVDSAGVALDVASVNNARMGVVAVFRNSVVKN